MREVARPRFWWLLVNLGTALLASAVIRLFDATIEKMVALAVLMPIVASMGGNAGTQTMTVAVRALGDRELLAANVGPRRVARDGRRAYQWRRVRHHDGRHRLLLVRLGPARGSSSARPWSSILLAAALAGIFIPLALDRMEFDPAVSSTVFVTTVTDVVGFFAFLSLASLWLV